MIGLARAAGRIGGHLNRMVLRFINGPFVANRADSCHPWEWTSIGVSQGLANERRHSQRKAFCHEAVM
jgi:hypothetical protein